MEYSVGALVRFPLAETGVELEVDRTYAWEVSVPFRRDGVSSAVVAEGFIRRLSASEAQGGDASVETLLAEGVWYDAMTRILADTIGTRNAVDQRRCKAPGR